MEELTSQFELEMDRIWKEIRDIHHMPTRFVQMLNTHGAVETAKRLASNKPTETFNDLAILHRLDLTVEYYIAMPKYQPLFDEYIIRLASERLEEYKDCQ